MNRIMIFVPEAVIYHAHTLTLTGFLRQHFYYGCGAALPASWITKTDNPTDLRRCLVHTAGSHPQES